MAPDYIANFHNITVCKKQNNFPHNLHVFITNQIISLAFIDLLSYSAKRKLQGKINGTHGKFPTFQPRENIIIVNLSSQDQKKYNTTASLVALFCFIIQICQELLVGRPCFYILITMYWLHLLVSLFQNVIQDAQS